MLVLTRKVGDVIAIGDNIKIVVMAIKGKQVRLGVQADRSTVVHREEIYQKIQQEIKAALQSDVNNTKVAGDMLRTATESNARRAQADNAQPPRSSTSSFVVRKEPTDASDALNSTDSDDEPPTVSRPAAKARVRRDKNSAGE